MARKHIRRRINRDDKEHIPQKMQRIPRVSKSTSYFSQQIEALPEHATTQRLRADSIQRMQMRHGNAAVNRHLIQRAPPTEETAKPKAPPNPDRELIERLLLADCVRMAENSDTLLRGEWVQEMLEKRGENETVKTAFTAGVDKVLTAKPEGAEESAENHISTVEALRSGNRYLMFYAGGQIRKQARAVIRALELIFIHDPDMSSLDLLSPKKKKRYKDFEWDITDFPGGKPGTHEKRADQMTWAKNKILPERRPNRGKDEDVVIITKNQIKQAKKKQDFDETAFWKWVVAEMEPVPDQSPHKLNRAACASFVEMHAAAEEDGVKLKILDANRKVSASKRRAAQTDNAKAVADFSAHNLGLAIDIKMAYNYKRDGKKHRKSFGTETSTGNFPKLIDMHASPAHKWMFLRGREFGWFPFHYEPWHWEYNPPGFRKQFFESWTGEVPEIKSGH